MGRAMFAAVFAALNPDAVRLRETWLSNVPKDLVSGLVVALALIPEAIAFSIIAGVSPQVGLYASFSIACITAIFGGRPAMISAATAAVAVLFKQITALEGITTDQALDLIFASTIIAGVFQVIAGLLRLGSLMRFVSRSVIIGFVNALAIIIFLAQVEALLGAIDKGYGVRTWTYVFIAAALAIIYGLPYLTKAVPSPLIAIIALTLISLVIGGDGWTVMDEARDKGGLPDGLPFFAMPDWGFAWQHIGLVLSVALAIAVVGLLESLMTANIVEEATETPTERNRECMGQGAANFVTGFFGGMAGCAMIGQSIINLKSGGRTRLSTFIAGIFLLILVVFLGDIVGLIPMAALVAVMVMVSIATFDWGSILALRTNPRASSVVMLATVFVTVYTHNLAIGVFTGVLLSGIFFAWKIASLFEATRSDEDGHRTYTLEGQLFFATVERLNDALHFNNAPKKVTIDVTKAHIWDLTAVNALDKAILKYRRAGSQVQVLGMNRASETLVAELTLRSRQARRHGAPPGALNRCGNCTPFALGRADCTKVPNFGSYRMGAAAPPSGDGHSRP